MKREPLYLTKLFSEKFEKLAKENLCREIERLEDPTSVIDKKQPRSINQDVF